MCSDSSVLSGVGLMLDWRGGIVVSCGPAGFISVELDSAKAPAGGSCSDLGPGRCRSDALCSVTAGLGHSMEQL